MRKKISGLKHASDYAIANRTAGIDAEAPPSSAQTQLEQLQADFNIQPGEVDMLIVDIPNIPPQDASVIMQTAAVVLKERSKPDSESLYGTMGVCIVSPTLARLEHMAHETESAFSAFSDGEPLYPQGSALRIFPDARFSMDLQAAAEAAPVQILQQPQHGTLVSKDGSFNYLPKQDYVGNDKVVFLVDIDGHKIKVVDFIKVVDAEMTGQNFNKIYRKYCPKSDWRISSSATEANSLVHNFDQSWFNFDQSNVTFSNITGAAQGEEL